VQNRHSTIDAAPKNPGRKSRKVLGEYAVIVNDSQSMKSPLVTWQQDLGNICTGIPSLLMSMLLCITITWCPSRAVAQGSEDKRIQTFALALPELEGPITVGIFSPRGELIRVLCRDAAVESIPAGLNGLIMTWDGRDAGGQPVLPGTYTVRGLVHGPLSFSDLPSVDTLGKDFSSHLKTEEWQENLPVGFEVGDQDFFHQQPLEHPDRLMILAAKDQLQEVRPWLRFGAVIGNPSITITAEGLPLAQFTPSVCPGGGKNNFPRARSITLHYGSTLGTARICLHDPQGSESYFVSGINKVVPLEAGTLEIPAAVAGAREAQDAADAFQSPPVGKESQR
jgi:hypothetical protein